MLKQLSLEKMSRLQLSIPATMRSFTECKLPTYHITFIDPRLPFPDSVGGIFPGPATTQKVYHDGIEWFSQLAGLQ